jgi:hypothetical protein
MTEPLILNIPDLSSKADTFFRQMDASITYRESFLRDPVGSLSRLLLGGPCGKSSARVSKTNQLLYALLSNQKFMTWSESFQKEVDSQVATALKGNEGSSDECTFASHINKTYYYRQIIKAMYESLDVETFEALITLDRETARAPTSRTEGGFVMKQDRPDRVSITLDPDSGENREVMCDICVVCIAIAVYAVALVAVFVVGFAGRVSDSLTRVDLQRIASMIVTDLTERAAMLRKEGELSVALPARNVILDSKKN